jgi:hypothetical protein
MIDDNGVEVMQLQSVLQRIQHALSDIPLELREYVANALLSQAVAHLVKKASE